MKKRIAVLSGDGIGPEVMAQALGVLTAVGQKFGHTFDFQQALIGGAAYAKTKDHFPQETKGICQESDAILFGSVGGPLAEAHLPKWQGCEVQSILALRQNFSFYANLRPIKIYADLGDISPLKADVIHQGVDLLIVRELLGDIYFGEHKRFSQEGSLTASDLATYSEKQIRMIAEVAFQTARTRRKKVTSVDKANVLETSKLWREVVAKVSKSYPDVKLEDMLVDNCAMQMVKNPSQFDVVLTSNLFGDILSDLAAALPGSLGLTPSASLNEKGFGLYEPSGGSAPDLAGKDQANPIAQVLSGALMLRMSFGMNEEAQKIENAIQEVIRAQFRTQDIYAKKGKLLGTKAMGAQIISRL